MASKEDTVTKAVKASLISLGLVDEENTAADIRDRDKAEFNPARDPIPLIIVSPGRYKQDDERYSSFDVGIVYPVQITFIGSSDRSTTSGRGLIQEWKETVRRKLEETQPFLIQAQLATSAPSLQVRDQLVTGGQPLDDKAWAVNYNVQVLFLFMEIMESYTPSTP